jgi:signal transduction histidine kinase
MKSPIKITSSAVLVLAAIVVVLGVAVAGITWWLRAGLREQILRREGDSLYAVTVMQQTLEADRRKGTEATGDADQLVLLALQSSRLRGVLGVQVIDGHEVSLHSMPTTLQLTAITAGEWTALRALQPVVRFDRAASLGKLYGLDDGPDEQTPLLEIAVPLHRPETTAIDGIARYVIEGQLIAGEFRLLDRSLARQAGLVWLLASGVIVTGVGGMLRRLAHTNRNLQERTDDLVRANRELALAAKTSALGAITAHLVHGLRNPIAGLEAFIEEQREEESPAQAGAWSEANATARRMRAMVNEVVELLQEEQSGTVYELSSREILTTVEARISRLVGLKKVSVAIEADDSGRLTNHQAGLITAILTNLAQNACEALPVGAGKVSLVARSLAAGGSEFRVEDNGPGLPAEVAAALFEARQSGKPGGAGIGLAISRQLAIHLGGTLELATNGSAGASFRLVIPGVNPS